MNDQMRPGIYPHQDLYKDAEVYSVMFSWDPAIEIKYITNIVKKFSPMNIRNSVFLDIGCGTGRIARRLSEHARGVVCLDKSFEMLIYGDAEVMRVNADMLTIPIRDNSINVAYNLLATINHLSSLDDLAQHISEVHRILKNDGLYIVDLVLEEPPCIGMCDEWNTRYRDMECMARHIVESVQDNQFIEVLELMCENKVIVRSRDALLLPRTRSFIDKALDSGFKQVIFLKPFTLKTMNKPQGRVFAVLIK